MFLRPIGLVKIRPFCERIMERMKMKRAILTVAFLMLTFLAGSAFGRAYRDISELPLLAGKTSAQVPNALIAVHNIGKIGISVTNQGHFGSGFVVMSRR